MVKEYGYEYNAEINETIFSATQWKSTDRNLWGAVCLRSGRDALKVIAKNYPGTKVFLPSLCCDSMITPFELYGCKIEFYPLTKTLSVDECAIFQMLANETERCILLYYDYFGLQMFSDALLEKIRDSYKNLIFVRDITHTLLTCKTPISHADYTVASLRKWTNIPDGGLLWTKDSLKDVQLNESPDFAMQRLDAQILRTIFLKNGDEEIKKQYRKAFAEISELLDEEAPVKMTEYAFQIASVTDWEAILKVRKENADTLRKIFASCRKITVLDSCERESNLYVPILLKNRDKIQSSLSSQGIFNTIIWPLREEQTDCCENARRICSSMLAVPCDQRYSKEDMEYIGNEIVRTICEENNDSGC